MVKRHVWLVTGGLTLSLMLIMFASLALAQEHVSQGDSVIPTSIPVAHVERREPIRLAAREIFSYTGSLEPIQLSTTERMAINARLPFTSSRLPKARVAERYPLALPLQRESKALMERSIGQAYPNLQSAPTRSRGSGDVRPAAVCTVNSTADSGPGSLRQCLEGAAVGDTITFETAIFPPISPVTISLSSALPWIVTDSLAINASDAGVILDGSGLSSGSGFVVAGTDGVTIRGLQIVRFPWDGVAIIGGATNTTIGGDRFTGSGPLGQGNLISGHGRDGVWIEDSGTMSNTVLGNYIGTDVFGTAAFPNYDGVLIGFGATNNIVGGDTPETRNLISGNEETGVWIQDVGTSGNQVLGNYIGTDVSGTAPLGNTECGMFIAWGAASNTVGGQTPGAGNLVSGNGRMGIWIQDEGTSGNQVLGNYIGTNVSGTAALGNAEIGVLIHAGATNNTIGGEVPGAGNLVSGNGVAGIWIEDVGTSGNQVLGNYIGTDVSGTAALANGANGVSIGLGATNNTIGWDTPGAGNLISGNANTGVWIQDEGTSGNQVLGNYIGTDVSGMAALPNYEGALIGFGAKNNVIGGEAPGAGNLISGNANTGVWIQNEGTSGNQVLGNYIGTDVSGMVALSNYEGALIGFGAKNNVIGGEAPGTGNLISGNTDTGVWIQDESTSGNQVLGNYIGTDVSGTAALGNGQNGVFIGKATYNVIGGEAPEARNLISGNGDTGVWLEHTGTSGNQVLGNYIGTDISGTAALGNGRFGVFIGFEATNNTIGGDVSGARNLVSGNEIGIWIQDEGTSGNQVLGNYIGTDVSGTAALGNGKFGMFVDFGAANNVIGGETSGARNLISGNGDTGVWIQGASENQVLGNYIGTDVSGTAALGNAVIGVLIHAGATNNTVGGNMPGARNLIGGNGLVGIWIEDAGTSGNQVLGNYIGTDGSGTGSLGNEQYGVFIGFDATHNTIGENNTIVYNAVAGVVVNGTDTLYNTVTRNVIHHNGGLPIDLVDLPIPVSPSPPMLRCFSSLSNTLLGTACPDCRVEIFANPSSTPAGTVFLGDVQAATSGGLALTLAALPPGQYLAATATDPEGTTSEFSDGFSWFDHPCFKVFLPLVTKDG